MKLVKFIYGTVVREYAVNDDCKLETLYRMVGYNPTLQEERFVNGQKEERLNRILIDKDIVEVKKKQELARMQVKIGRVNERIYQYDVFVNATVGELLSISGLLLEPNDEIWIHQDGKVEGARGTLGTRLTPGIIVVLEKSRLESIIRRKLSSWFQVDEFRYELTERAKELIQIIKEDLEDELDR